MLPSLHRYRLGWAQIIIMTVCFCGYANAFELKPIKSDHTVVSTTSEVSAYRWSQGAAKKVSGRYFADKEERINGRLQRQVWEIGSDVDPDTTHQFMFNQVLSYHPDVVFDCSGLDCGFSNVWANQLLGVPQLYGRDTDQYYTTVSFTVDGQAYVLSVYTVQRGNRRVYQLADLIAVAGDTPTVPEAISNIERSHLAFNPEDIQDHQKAVELALGRLRKDPVLRLLIVGRSTGKTFSQNLADSQQLAQQSREELIAAGIPSQRIDILGIGDYESDSNGSLLAINSLIELWFR